MWPASACRPYDDECDVFLGAAGMASGAAPFLRVDIEEREFTIASVPHHCDRQLDRDEIGGLLQRAYWCEIRGHPGTLDDPRAAPEGESAQDARARPPAFALAPRSDRDEYQCVFRRS